MTRKKKIQPNPAAQELGRLGGLARARGMTAKARRDAAKHAIRARWGNRLERMALDAGFVKDATTGKWKKKGTE